jgi:DNA-binding beta-propeller fold protein YncE
VAIIVARLVTGGSICPASSGPATGTLSVTDLAVGDRYVWVANEGPEASAIAPPQQGYVTTIDPHTGSVVGNPIKVSRGAGGIAVDQPP